jgi:hypothetical protein
MVETQEHPLARERELARTPGRSRGRTVALVIALVAAVALAVAALVVAWPDRDGTEDTSATTVPSTTEPTTTPTTQAPTTESPATTAPATTAPTAPAPVDTTTAVFPTTGGVRYADPVAAARAFAVDFVGFTDPIVGQYEAGDARSGEVPVRAYATGAVTTVLVRQLGTDGSWWVLGAATPGIVVDTPSAGDTIRSPMTTTGSALAWEGAVAVEVRQDGQAQPLGTTVVTGGGDMMRPFSGAVTFTEPGAPHGAVLHVSHSAQDGRVMQATVVRVAFSRS